MIYTNLTRTAMQIAFRAHEGQVDKAGMPYINHPLHVAESMPDEITTAAALLHDVLEDTAVTRDDLAAAGIPERVLEILDCLTHAEGEPYDKYLARVKEDADAVLVKRSDIAHNSDFTRLPAEDSRIPYFREKYRKALEFLNA